MAGLPVRANASARCCPMARGRRYDTPQSGVKPIARVGEDELGRRRGDDHVAAEHQRQPRPGDRTLHGGDDGLLERRQRPERRVELGRQPVDVRRLVGGRREGGHVATGAEPRSRAGDEDARTSASAGGPLHGGGELPGGVEVERVGGVGTVELDVRDAVGDGVLRRAPRQTLRNSAASAWPPPMHMVTMPSSRSRRTRSLATRSDRIAPVAPTGWPSAIAPPYGLTFAGSSLASRMTATACEAKASLSSMVSMSPGVSAGLLEERAEREDGRVAHQLGLHRRGGDGLER